jgi:hypothetical protein
VPYLCPTSQLRSVGEIRLTSCLRRPAVHPRHCLDPCFLLRGMLLRLCCGLEKRNNYECNETPTENIQEREPRNANEVKI